MRGKRKKRKSRQANRYPDNPLPVGILLSDTVRAGVIENDAGISRISPFGRGGNIEKILFQPQLKRVKNKNK